jgi:cytochrome c-type biogenesis protein CcmF
VIIVGFGLIAWRGDRLRSPGGIDAPLGREGAFLLNNLLFVGFAFVVLLGTVFPLLYEAMRHQQVTVGAPYFNTVAVPVGLGLLFLMAVAPALSWRKMSGSALWSRLAVPAWLGVLTVVACVLAGVRGLAPLVAIGLGAFAAGSAGRALVLSVRRAHQQGAGAWRGLVGRANGGMVVHLGVVLLAVGLTCATSYAQRTDLALKPGVPVTWDGHTFTFERMKNVTTPARQATEALVRVDGGGVFRPAYSQYGGFRSQVVGTPAIDSGLFGDVYLTIEAVGGQGPASGGTAFGALPKGEVGIAVVVEPLIPWMWAGGLLVGAGGLLALIPGRRRRATDPVSAPAHRMPGAPPPDNGHVPGAPNGRHAGDHSPEPTVAPADPVGAEAP